MIKTAAAYRAGMATDAGLQRSNNEDRAHTDESSGVFLVVDGMGGHAAGEQAAEMAVEMIPRVFESQKGSIESRIRKAIATANNEIYRMSATRDDWNGMACVLTLAVAHDDKITIGHVGDSRLYLAGTGGLRKLTSDHSPVGEREDRGDLTEAEAMNDPRRNQVFRDIGSQPRDPSDENFIETKSFPFRADAAVLLCTDGLSDVVTNAEMNAIVQRYGGDPRQTARELVDAANQAGGKDNVTVVFVAGPEFAGAVSKAHEESRARHSITRMKRTRGPWAVAVNRGLWMVAGMLLGAAGLALWERAVPAVPPSIASRDWGGRHIMANPADPHSITALLSAARAGDVIQVPKGEYLGPLVLREGVDVISIGPGETVIRADASGVGVTAHSLKAARVTGLRIVGDAIHPLSTGLLIDGASIEVDELDVSGSSQCGVIFTGNSAGVLRSSYIHGNSGCGLRIEGESSPRIVANRIEGRTEIVPPANPTLIGNLSEKQR